MFGNADKWYKEKPEHALENKMRKFLWTSRYQLVIKSQLVGQVSC